MSASDTPFPLKDATPVASKDAAHKRARDDTTSPPASYVVLHIKTRSSEDIDFIHLPLFVERVTADDVNATPLQKALSALADEGRVQTYVHDCEDDDREVPVDWVTILNQYFLAENGPDEDDEEEEEEEEEEDVEVVTTDPVKKISAAWLKASTSQRAAESLEHGRLMEQWREVAKKPKKEKTGVPKGPCNKAWFINAVPGAYNLTLDVVLSCLL